MRGESKQHGMYKQIEGHFDDGATVAVYDDTISTGQSLLKAISILECRHATFKVAMCILDRQLGGSFALEEKNIPLFNILVRNNNEITVDETKIRQWFAADDSEQQSSVPSPNLPIEFGFPSRQEENEEMLVTA